MSLYNIINNLDERYPLKEKEDNYIVVLDKDGEEQAMNVAGASKNSAEDAAKDVATPYSKGRVRVKKSYKNPYDDIEENICEDCDDEEELEENICEDCDDEEELEENNVTANLDGGLGQPKTPFAFQGGRSTDKKKERENATSSTGFKLVTPSNNYVKRKNEMFNRIGQQIDKIDEARYADYRADETLTAKQKINKTISEINRKMYEVEHMIGHASKLKTEVGMNQEAFWQSTMHKFTKISERMLRIGNKLREFKS